MNTEMKKGPDEAKVARWIKWVPVASLGLGFLIAVAIIGYQLFRAPEPAKPAPRVTAPAPAAPAAPAPAQEPKPEAPKPKPYGITAAPAELPATGINLSWEEVLAAALTEMAEVAKWARESKTASEAERIQALVEEGLLHSFGSPIPMENLLEAALLVYKSPLASVAYRWGMPFVKEAFKTFPPESQTAYFQILDYASNYLGKLTPDYYQTEVRYWENLEKQGCYGLSEEQRKRLEWVGGKFSECTSLFSRFGPDGKRNPFRKVEVEIFRRVHVDKLDAKVMKTWLDGAIAYLRKP